MYSQIYSKGLLLYIAISGFVVSSGCIHIAEGAGDEHIKPIKSSVNDHGSSNGDGSSSLEPDQGTNNSKSYCVTLKNIEENDWYDGPFDRSPEPYGRVCAINSNDARYQRRAKHVLSQVIANCKDLWFEKDKNIGTGPLRRRNWSSTDFLLNFDDFKKMYEGDRRASTISGIKTMNASQTITVGDSTRDTVDVLILPMQEHDSGTADDPLYDYTGGGSFDGNSCPASGRRPAGCGSDKGYKDDFPIVISLNDTNLAEGEHNFTRELRGKQESTSFIGSTRYYNQRLIFSFTFSNGACE